MEIGAYASRYEQPSSTEEGIKMITKIYSDLIEKDPESSVLDGLSDHYHLLEQRGLPAFSWIVEAIHKTSRKSEDKKHFPYLVGMLRTWMKNGFGSAHIKEEEEIVEYFREVVGSDVSPQARQIIQHLMGTYGIIKLTKMIGDLKEDVDFSYLVASALKDKMDNQYKTTA